MTPPTDFDIAHEVTTIARGLLSPGSEAEYNAALEAAMSTGYDALRNLLHVLVQLADKPGFETPAARVSAVAEAMGDLAAKGLYDELPRWGIE